MFSHKAIAPHTQPHLPKPSSSHIHICPHTRSAHIHIYLPKPSSVQPHLPKPSSVHIHICPNYLPHTFTSAITIFITSTSSSCWHFPHTSTSAQTIFCTHSSHIHIFLTHPPKQLTHIHICPKHLPVPHYAIFLFPFVTVLNSFLLGACQLWRFALSTVKVCPINCEGLPHQLWRKQSCATEDIERAGCGKCAYNPLQSLTHMSVCPSLSWCFFGII